MSNKIRSRDVCATVFGGNVKLTSNGLVIPYHILYENIYIKLF